MVLDVQDLLRILLLLGIVETVICQDPLRTNLEYDKNELGILSELPKVSSQVTD